MEPPGDVEVLFVFLVEGQTQQKGDFGDWNGRMLTHEEEVLVQSEGAYSGGLQGHSWEWPSCAPPLHGQDTLAPSLQGGGALRGF